MGLTSSKEKWTEVSSYKWKRRGFYRGEENYTANARLAAAATRRSLCAPRRARRNFNTSPTTKPTTDATTTN
jgi:hypothetical protein